jgi:hypothetical protein
VSYILADDEGHGFAKPINRMAMYAEIERFLAPILNGRYQEDMPAEVAQRLEEMRVDIQTVTYEEKAPISVAGKLPQLKNKLSEGNYKYSLDIQVQGQNISASKTRTIAKEGDLWKITEVTSSMMGEATDITLLSNRPATSEPHH